MLCFFRSLIDFDWIKGHLISGRVEFGSGRFSLTFLKNWIGSDSGPDGSDGFLESDSGPDGSDGFLESGRVLPPLSISTSLIFFFLFFYS
jgi:hypothetical protein